MPWFLIGAVLWFADALLLTTVLGFGIWSVICVIVALIGLAIHIRENA